MQHGWLSDRYFVRTARTLALAMRCEFGDRVLAAVHVNGNPESKVGRALRPNPRLVPLGWAEVNA